MAINLFDINSTQNMSKLPPKPGSFMDYLEKTKQQGIQQPTMQQPTKTSGFTPKAEAKTQEFSKEDLDNFRDLLSKGIEPERAKQVIIKAKQPVQEKQSLVKGIGQAMYKASPLSYLPTPTEVKTAGANLIDSFTDRTGKVTESFGRETTNALQPLGTALQTAGQGIGALGDVAFEGIKLATPESVKNALTGGAKTAWEKTPESVKTTAIEALKAGGEMWQGFKEQNPFMADAIEGSLNIASAVPIGKGAQVSGKVATAGLEGFETAGKQVLKTGGKVVDTLTPDTQKIATKVSTKANRFNAVDEEKFIQTTGQTPGEFAVERGMTDVGENAVEKASTNYISSMKQADEAFDQIGGNYKYTGKGNDPIKLSLDDLEKRGVNTEASFTPRVQELLNKYDTEGLTMPEINEVKRLYSKNFKYGFEDRNSEALARSSNIQNKLREWQFGKAEEMGFTNLKDINKTTQAWKLYADSLEKKLNRSGANNAVGITDWIALSGGNASNLALFLGKKLGTSDRAKQLLIKTLGKQTKGNIIKANVNKPNIKGYLPRGPIITPAPKGQATIKVTTGNEPRVMKDMKALPPSLMTTKQAVITPQTKEAGVIQESKLELKNTKYGNNNNLPNNRNNNLMDSKLTPTKNELPKVIKKPTTKTLPKTIKKPK